MRSTTTRTRRSACVRARPLSGRSDGDLVRAEERARAAVTIAAGTDYRLRSIESLSRLADVLAAAGRLSEAREALDRAIALAREKESVAHERILCAKLAELTAQPPATA